MTTQWNPNYLVSQMAAAPVVAMGQVYIDTTQAKAEKAEMEMRHRRRRRRRR